ncbi:MAG: peptidylprolyl isomerase [Bacteroidales bacterium]|jgi:peptidyl-prolyl cis-trans isomerase SurA|nr:peptidylprolyl isomerase [Bacteroidales bacterium]
MKKLYSVCILAVCSFYGFSQSKPAKQPEQKPEQRIILTVGDKKISEKDFTWFYNKYNSYVNDSLRLNYDDAMELFITYIMKISEAEALSLDTTAHFKEEFNSYLQSEAKAFLYAGAQSDEDFTRMEYNRLKKDYKIEHYFVKSSRYAAPADTLAAYNKALKIKKLTQQYGNLNKAVEIVTKGDSIPQKADDLGYVTALLLPLNYENLIYTSKKGDVVGPILNDYGYYIAHVTDVRPTRGASQVSAIIFYPDAEKSDSSWQAIQQKADAAYAQLQAGVDFKTVSKSFNTHPQLLKDDGAIGWVDNSMRFDPQLKEDVFALQVGEFSKPRKYDYGYVILTVNQRDSLPSYASFQKSVANALRNDPSRKGLDKKEMLAAQRNHAKMKVYSANVEEFVAQVDNSILLGRWKKPELKQNKVLFTVSSDNYYFSDFAQYLETMQVHNNTEPDKGVLVRKQLARFQDKKLEEFAMYSLINSNPQFAAIMQEYHDGMIIYELLNSKVFSKVTTDSVGLANFYAKNAQSFIAPKSFEALVFSFNNAKEEKAIRKALNQPSVKFNYAIESLRSKFPEIHIDTVHHFAGDAFVSAHMDSVQWQQGGIYTIAPAQILYINEVFEPHQMTFEESRMLIIPLYQEYLEAELTRKLKEKYPYSINETVFGEIKATAAQ